MTHRATPGRPLRYAGYRSYAYLEPGRDYRVFELASETDRVPPFTVEVSDAEEARTWRLLATHPAISLHDHAEIYPRDLAEGDAWVRDAHPFTGYEGLARSGLAAVFENFGDGTATITSKSGWKWSDVIADIGVRYADWAHQDFVVRGETVADIHRAFANGQLAMIGALEAATPIENELDRIDVLYGFGIRMLGVVYSESNALGSGCRETTDGGLTGFGRRAVERMNRLGILIDVSHAGDRTSLDTVEASTAPVCISHSGSRELWPISKCKPDDVIRACAERGGIIGIEAAPGTTMVKPDLDEASIETFMRHFEYCVELVGIDAVTFGPDTFFGDHSGTYHSPQGALLASGDSEYDAIVPEYVVGLENIGEYPNIVRWLVKHGYSDDEIAKAIGGNTLRVLEQAWAR
ncbi:MAG TPA: membrane dipeptidase [Candidatus Limnocylindrales bacterium]|nr:membrane dipeptidase [Candidatus Limnocylindrales bacterium]